MCLNDAGVMVECWYAELQNKFPNVQCHEMVVMPNHFHCVVEIVDGGAEKGEHAGSPLPHTLSLLGTVVQWFKTMTTNEYIRGVKNSGWQPFDGKLWQRNYYENIIRNEISYQRIANYIDNNPVNWEKDRLK